MPLPANLQREHRLPAWRQPHGLKMSLGKEKELISLAKKKEDLPAELESQFILRLPSGPAIELKKALRSGAMNVKDRLSIQVEPDMRHGMVRFDNWIFSAKLVDVPCVIESLKTIDKKTFYKTADICQMLVCKEEDDSQTTEDEESPKKKEEKDRTKADKKFLWPHGVTPSLKNVRKRRFRKTLKKKYVDAPEIEKEVKRLFRVDNEAVSVRWEIITDEEDTGKKPLMGESLTSSAASPAASGLLLSNSQSLDVAEHDLFGEEVSSSEDEHDVNIMDSGDDESSRLSGDTPTQDVKMKRELVTEFTKEMLQGGEYSQSDKVIKDSYSSGSQDHIMAALEDAGLVKQELAEDSGLVKHELGDDERETIIEKLEDLQQQLLDVQARRAAQEQEISSIDNQALKQRFQSILESLIEEESEKQREYDELTLLLNR